MFQWTESEFLIVFIIYWSLFSLGIEAGIVLIDRSTVLICIFHIYLLLCNLMSLWLLIWDFSLTKLRVLHFKEVIHNAHNHFPQCFWWEDPDRIGGGVNLRQKSSLYFNKPVFMICLISFFNGLNVPFLLLLLPVKLLNSRDLLPVQTAVCTCSVVFSLSD